MLYCVLQCSLCYTVYLYCVPGSLVLYVCVCSQYVCSMLVLVFVLVYVTYVYVCVHFVVFDVFG